MTLRSMNYIINLDPISWKRAGAHAKKNADFHFYDKQKHEKLAFGLHINKQHGDEPPFKEHPLEIHIVFWMPIPKSVHKRTTYHQPWHFKRPDLDNLEKFLLDTITTSGIWEDDCLVSRVVKEKKYSKYPRTEFTISELE